MKTMTCKQLGGPCEFTLTGENADEVIQQQDQHLKDAVAAGETDHDAALAAMKKRWRRPVSGLKWYNQTKRDFAELPED
ncbi:MAG: DUF1059 domain-containing protein [Actinomycetota bacterium]|nr:DUF1059 domain-containing protein [Actinomycetota bacterium]